MREADKGRKESLRRQKLLAAQAKPTATEAGEVNALVIGIGPGLCSVDIEGSIRHVRCEIPTPLMFGQDESEAEKLNDQIVQFYRQGKYAEAVPLRYGRWQSAKRRWDPTIQTPPKGSPTSRLSTVRRGHTPK